MKDAPVNSHAIHGLDRAGGGHGSAVTSRAVAACSWLAILAGSVAPLSSGGARELIDLSDLPRGQWTEIPGSRLSDVAASPSPGGAIGRITAWSSAALDARRLHLLVWGGGHADYAGNEVYAFDIAHQEWRRLTEPSVADTGRGETYADGRPRARHTYNYLEYVPGLDRMISFGGAALYPHGGTASRQLAEFDVETHTWSIGRRSPVPDVGNMIGTHARVDARSGDVFVLPSQQSRLLRYSPSTDRWTEGRDRAYVRVHSTAAIDPDRRLFVVIGSGGRAGRQAWSWDLDRLGPPIDLRSKTTGAFEIEAAYGPGFDFHPPSGRFVAWAGGGDVYVLDPSSWRWSRVPPSPGGRVDPGPPSRTGTYGRFRYVESIDAFILVNAADQNVYLYRLPARAGGTARAPPATNTQALSIPTASGVHPGA